MTEQVKGVVVEQLSDSPVKTKFGEKRVFSFRANGVWYKTGFKNSGVGVGDTVDILYESGKWGNETTSIAKVVTAPVATSTPPKPSPTATYGGKGVFPIPALDGQRAIVRQNALTNAREYYTAILMHNSGLNKYIYKEENVDEHITRIIELARKLEAYSCGDLDMEEVKAELDEAKKT